MTIDVIEKVYRGGKFFEDRLRQTIKLDKYTSGSEVFRLSQIGKTYPAHNIGEIKFYGFNDVVVEIVRKQESTKKGNRACSKIFRLRRKDPQRLMLCRHLVQLSLCLSGGSPLAVGEISAYHSKCPWQGF